MSLFLAMLTKLFPLYATMGAGVALARAFGNLSGALAQIQIYLIVPVVILSNMMKLSFSADLLILPCVLGLICLGISATTNFMARKVGSEYAPLLAQASGAANLGYLGIPIAVILFPENLLPVYVLTTVGGLIYESLFGYYWMARGKYSPRTALRSLLRLPVIYAMIAGLALNKMGITIPVIWESVERDFLGAYIILGALIIGLGFMQQGRLRINVKLVSIMCGIKFLVWPLVMATVLALLRLTPFAIPQVYEPLLLLTSFLPLAANTAAYAALLNVHPEEAATAVAISTVLSLGIIPAYVLFFGFAHG